MTGNGGSDTLTGNGGSDVFDYNNTTDGNDTITDFTKGTDKLDIKDLLVGYDSNSTLSEFITSEVSGSDTIVKVDANGTTGNSGAFTADIEITLTGVTGIDLSAMLSSNDLIVL
ncbi:MAG: type I secretion C-terminal target domain-containing protein [Candidatus Thiodubiliella endoseptemdiera]|uniref:Type I secretion C-terminal target domain-containing protein n=1 Tax=Candidatus Thiodubiliella endoseptemdiera TaxID=2738886 RepID=A0A853F5G5_9GAMM|nr:type I secretion C-terminal target domain-containing protein [Candidatus Thiodubiliella endoseptemdiera]